MLLACCTALGQTAGDHPSFEVASVKPNTEFQGFYIGGRGMTLPGCHGGPDSSDPGRYTCYAATLAGMVRMAYNLKPYQATFPDWMNRGYFDIAANVPAGTTLEQFRLMQQNLLAERFKLAVHFEKKEMQTYEMTVGKDGPKFKEWVDLPPQAQGDRPASGPVKAADLRPSPEGPTENMNVDGRHSRRGKQSMEALAVYLTLRLERPVIDATGLTGEYDIMLDFVMEPPSLPGRGGVSPDSGAAPPEPPVLAAGPTLYSAVQSQLGLKLEASKHMIDVLVVDHAEKAPTEN